MSAHTPGPWWVEHGGQIFGNLDLSVEPGAEDVCVVADTLRSEANARLIAATPRLLAALVQLADNEYRDDDDPILIAARIEARAAIAKATGGA